MDSSSGKIFAVGDIHGCFDKLDELLGRLSLDLENDTIIFLGDYINRGPNTREVIERLVEIQKMCGRAVFLKGNHEQALLSYAESHDSETLHILRGMGVEKTAESYGSSMAGLKDLACFPAEHREFLQSLEFAFAIGSTIFTHAGIDRKTIDSIRNGEKPAMDDPVVETTLLSSRRFVFEKTVVPGCTIVFGHIPFATPLVMDDRIGIDTGAVYGNRLTALELPAKRFHHA